MDITIFLWNKCNARCSHCMVGSSPEENGALTDEQIFGLIDSAFLDSVRPVIRLSGGEPFLNFERFCRVVRSAFTKGAIVGAVTNGFWGTSLDEAVSKLRKIKEAGLTGITVSFDDFHEEYIPSDRVLNVIRACRKIGVGVNLLFTATRSSRRLGDFLRQHGDDLLGISCQESPCHPAGRAETNVKDDDLIVRDDVPECLCPSSFLSVSSQGRYIPCCSPAGFLPFFDFGSISEPLPGADARFRRDPVMRILRSKGPKAFLEAAVKAGYAPRAGYVDHCHLCFEMFRGTKIANDLRNFATEEVYILLAQKQLYDIHGSGEG